MDLRKEVLVKRRVNSRPPEPSKITLLLVIFAMVLLGRCAGVKISDTVEAYKGIMNERSVQH